MWRSFFLLLVLSLVGCRSFVPAEAGVLQREFRQAHGPATDTEAAGCERPFDRDPGITEISIERTACFGACPTYTLRLFSDGRVEYRGQASVSFIGTREGKLDVWRFRRLARDAEGIGFFQLPDHYSCTVTDQSTVYVAVTRNGQRKVVEHYAPDWSGPAALRLLEQAIDAVQPSIEWR